MPSVSPPYAAGHLDPQQRTGPRNERTACRALMKTSGADGPLVRHTAEPHAARVSGEGGLTQSRHR